ncbi:hypothetical protein V1477_001593 [Vespula maculifrons]|uniref:Uncharacterized protein n=1 Tax=Vespula maculifrons TaxID=7453 RepID=A0ABD2CY98_VESMC
MQGQSLKHRVAPNDRCLIETIHRRSHRVVHDILEKVFLVSAANNKQDQEKQREEEVEIEPQYYSSCDRITSCEALTANF